MLIAVSLASTGLAGCRQNVEDSAAALAAKTPTPPAAEASPAPVAPPAADAAPGSEADVKKNMQERYPGIPVESVARTPLPGIYEVYANGVILYTDAKVNYLIADGRLVDANTRTDLTGERLRKLQAIPFDALPLQQSFKVVRGNGKRKLAYFTDPNCPYCKRLEQELANLDDVTLQVFLLPILSADSADKARAVWCAKDPAKAWTDLMLKDVQPPPPPAKCDAPLDRLVAYAQDKGIKGTPTLIFSDGSRVPGVLPAADLNKLIELAAAPARPGG
jgi:thiol:disulfide interchange protein DsbC